MPLKRVNRSVPENLCRGDFTVSDPNDRKVTRLGDTVIQGSLDSLNRRADSDADSTDYQLMQDESDGSDCSKTFCAYKQRCWRLARKTLPILSWLPKYKWKEDLFYDISGGTTIALICLVQTLAHAAIATTKIIQGPYTALVPPTVYAFFGTSPHVSIASGAIAAIMIADQLQAWDDVEERTKLASLLSLTSGLMLLVMGACKAAFMVRFLSQSLISGFVTGGAILIILGQAKNLLGLDHLPHSIGAFHTTRILFENIGDTDMGGLYLGLLGILFLQAAMWTKKRMVREIKEQGPHTIKNIVKILTETKELVLVFGSLFFAWFTCPVGGDPLVPVVGSIPAGLPNFRYPWEPEICHTLLTSTDEDVVFRCHHFLIGSAMVALTSFLTTYATSQKQALAYGYTIDASQEMVALGLAATGGSFFGSFAPSGSLSRTSLASEVGVRSQLSGFMKMIVIGTSLVYITPVLYFMPKAALAAVIMRSAWNLLDFATMRSLLRQSTHRSQWRWKPYRQGGMMRDLVVWWIAFVLTLVWGVLYGIGSAVIVSVGLIVKDAVMPKVVELACIEQFGGIWRNRDVWPMGKTIPGVLVVEFRGPLSFASADHFQDQLELRRKSADIKVEVIVLCLGSVHDLDHTALTTLRDVFTLWRKEGVSCIVADAKSRVRLLLEEHFAQDKSAPLLDQPAFIIGIDDAVYFARRKLKKNADQDELRRSVTTCEPQTRRPYEAQDARAPRFGVGSKSHWGRTFSAEA